MELKIYWTNFAKNELRKIYKYFKENASLRIAKNEIQKIRIATHRLKKHPELGQVEQLLAVRKLKFRYLIHQRYKIIYWINIDQNQIEIFDVFDTKQNPTKIERS